MVSLGIATGFERRYGVLKRLGVDAAVARRPARREDGDRARDRDRAGAPRRASSALAIGWDVPAGIFARGRAAAARHGRVRGHRHADGGHAARRGEPRGRQRAVPRAAVPRRHGVPAVEAAGRRSKTSPSCCPAAALSETVRAVLAVASVPGRRVRRAGRVGDRRAAARRALLPLGGVARDPLRGILAVEGAQHAVELGLLLFELDRDVEEHLGRDREELGRDRSPRSSSRKPIVLRRAAVVSNSAVHTSTQRCIASPWSSGGVPSITPSSMSSLCANSWYTTLCPRSGWRALRQRLVPRDDAPDRRSARARARASGRRRRCPATGRRVRRSASSSSGAR